MGAKYLHCVSLLLVLGTAACAGEETEDSPPSDSRPSAGPEPEPEPDARQTEGPEGTPEDEPRPEDPEVAGGQSGGQSDPPEVEESAEPEGAVGPAEPMYWGGIGEVDEALTPPAFVPLSQGPLEERPTLETHAGVVYAVSETAILRLADGALETLLALDAADTVPRLQVADLDADASAELILVRTHGLSVWTLVEGAYEEVWSARLRPDSGLPLLVDDLDQDGALDLVTNLGGALRWYRGDGNLSFSVRTPETDPLDAITVACERLFAADVDADGDRDIVGVYWPTTYESGSDHDAFVAVFTNEGDAMRFSLLGARSLGSSGIPILADSLIDFDADGYLDLAGYVGTDTRSGYWFSRGIAGGGFRAPTPIDVDVHVGGYRTIRAGDLNGDGQADLLVSGLDGAAQLRGDGDGGFTTEALPTNLGTPSSAVIRKASVEDPATIVAVLSRSAYDLPESCDTNDACPCLFGRCAACITDSDCPRGVCVESECVECRDDTGCTANQACLGNRCRRVVTRVDDWVDFATGYGAGCGVRATGELGCWGYDDVELPIGSFLDVVLVDPELGSGCAIDVDHRVVCWPDPYSAYPAPELEGRFQALSGRYSLCGLALDGGIRCLTGTPPSSTDFVQVSAAERHACGLHADGRAECWTLGDGGDEAVLNPPTTPYSWLGSGTAHSCGVRQEDGGVECWGRNNYSQGSAPNESFTSVEAGNNTTCGITTAGAVDCWGLRPWGPTGTDFTVLSVSGDADACALRRDGRIQCSFEVSD